MYNFVHAESSNILVFGGNGFMGATTVEHMIQRGDNISIVNRGHWYWDSEQTIKPFVRHFKCDRGVSLHSCEPLQSYVDNNSDLFFDAVVDFSAYDVQAVIEVIRMLKGKIGRYIYISSDSVYEVCIKNHTMPTREVDAIRPWDSRLQIQNNQKDDYGHRKLECEEILAAQRRNSEFAVPYISLRLPDVIGPRDNTYRWWMYQMWIRLGAYLDRPLSVPRYLLNRRLSLVYSEDIADLIIELLTSDLTVFDDAYNLAFEETPTLLELVDTIKQYANSSHVSVDTEDTSEHFNLFPSVTLGAIDIEKATKLLKWKPTPFHKAAMDTVMFYEAAIKRNDFTSARKEIIRRMQAQFTKQPNHILYALNGVYGLNYLKRHDEL